MPVATARVLAIAARMPLVLRITTIATRTPTRLGREQRTFARDVDAAADRLLPLATLLLVGSRTASCVSKAKIASH